MHLPRLRYCCVYTFQAIIVAVKVPRIWSKFLVTAVHSARARSIVSYTFIPLHAAAVHTTKSLFARGTD